MTDFQRLKDTLESLGIEHGFYQFTKPDIIEQIEKSGLGSKVIHVHGIRFNFTASEEKYVGCDPDGLGDFIPRK